ncbi:MAG: radical SAM protein [Armatimonadetes bacterium]|nr:radical SAM protein [Armatimonadota bacterium]MDW8028862.1 radical SAM protein [Armatimonadota bacterium]
MARCQICGKVSRTVARVLSLCSNCLKLRFEELEETVKEVHARSRRPFLLPESPPAERDGILCAICSQGCRIPKGGIGYCGLPHGDRKRTAIVSWYYDPLPTNCVADFVCPAGTGCGFPKYAYRSGPEFGYKNLAVFYEACSLNCLFCQNWHYRYGHKKKRSVTPEELANAVDERTACICYFGGDPTPQLPHSIEASRIALERNSHRILRICWETNGNMNPKLLDRMVEIALVSGGCIKFDLKAWSESLHIALTGISNRQTLENFERVASRINERPEVPLLVASTLLVPGYVDVDEVANIARFIARLSPDIPYSLLAFHPDFLMDDLPTTSLEHMRRCYEAAKDAGLKTVHIGNRHLLWFGDYDQL